jgi:undecaprenyl-diphosphatase
MYLMSDTYSWVPLYLCFLYLIYRKYNLKIAAASLIFIALVIFLCDRLSVIAFKDVFRRYRPCHNLAISHLVYTLNGYCGGLYGFVSSHAANSFGLALFFGNMLKKESKWLFILILFWASAVAYSRVYLGVHYPGDIIGGAFLGISVGWVVYKVFDSVLINA